MAAGMRGTSISTTTFQTIPLIFLSRVRVRVRMRVCSSSGCLCLWTGTCLKGSNYITLTPFSLDLFSLAGTSRESASRTVRLLFPASSPQPTAAMMWMEPS